MLLILLNKIYKAGKTTRNYLPHRKLAPHSCGSIFSACFLFALCSSILQAQAAGLDAVRTQGNEAVTQAMQQLLATEASRQGWQGMRVQIENNVIGAQPAAPCARPLELSRNSDAPSLLARQRFTLTCPGQADWQMTLLSQATVFIRAVHAATVLERGASIARSDLKLKEIDLSKARRGFFSQIDAVAGKSVKRRVRTNQLLNPSLLTAPLLVRRGDRVKIIATDSGIEASASGEALADGERDEVIRVRNLSSEKVIDAKVLDSGLVTSTYN